MPTRLARRLAASYNGDPKQNGLFTDFTDTALEARAEYLRQVGDRN